MKLTDENGGEWETDSNYAARICTAKMCSTNCALLVIRKLEKPANPMPELVAGLCVRVDDHVHNRKNTIVIQSVSPDDAFWGINLTMGWRHEKFFKQQIIEISYPGINDIIWSREP